MPDVALDDREVGPAPLRRAVLGLLLGVATGAVAACLLPGERRAQRTPAAAREVRRR